MFTVSLLTGWTSALQPNQQ